MGKERQDISEAAPFQLGAPRHQARGEEEGQQVRRPFKLIAINGVSRDTVECLRMLLEQAEKGEIIGVSYAAMHRKRHFTTHSCGETHRNPVFASGMVGALWFDLQRQARGEA